LFSKKKQEGEIVLIFDIGSASVGAALAFLKPSGVPKVLYSTRRQMVFQKKLNFTRFTSSMLTTLEQTIRDVERHGLPHLTFTKRGGGSVSRILCSYASPWYISQVKVLTLKKDRPFIISEEVVDALIKKEEERIKKSKGRGEIEKSGGDALSIERQVINITIEGYNVGNPYGKRVNEATMTVALTMISRELRDKVSALLNRNIATDDILHHSFSLIGFSVVRDFENTPPDFLFIDVSGEVTDISLVKNDTLLETVSFPRGKHFVLRHIAEGTHTSPEEASTLIRMYLEGSSNADTTLGFETHVALVQKEWADAFGKALDGLSSDMAIPHVVYLTADIDMAGLFSRFIKENKAHQDMFTGGTFAVTELRGSHVAPYVTFRGGVVTDSFLALEAVYFNKIAFLV